ncbi:hypothetical protein HNQ60_004089 [Povalibacter uvarum]|uniref:DUF4381 domain-containing protein n=1 Tax=Povalibacter uvarum TaxID=732238 RepID=A0A841HSC2_9GAMM|nr:DUF4381 domain-containing protein [Povalibacter uvarum]MBB6095199.1 hypothetical protein [Povalibacter uvarum]
MAAEQHYAGDPLANLQEIAEPPVVPYFPQTAGWAVVGGVVLLALIYIGWKVARHRRANAYRREALAELARIEAESSHAALPALLKRTAIAAASRSAVASLTGEEWLRFLDRSLGGDQFEKGPGQLLPRIAYATSLPADISTEELRSLIDLSRRWIRRHDTRRALSGEDHAHV